MSRNVYLITYPVEKVAAHWGIFIPYSDASNDTGTIIHTVGSPFVGFKVNFKRGYNQAQSPRPHELHSLGKVENRFLEVISSGETTGTQCRRTDAKPTCEVETAALAIEPPSPERLVWTRQVLTKLLPCIADDEAEHARDCQSWIAEYVGELVRRDILPPSALDTMESLRFRPIGMQTPETDKLRGEQDT